jgi:hypothetical protein
MWLIQVRERWLELLSDKEIWKMVMFALPRTEKEREGCLSEMQRMYDLRKKYEKELRETLLNVSKPTFNKDAEAGPELIPPFDHLKTLSKAELEKLNNSNDEKVY